MIANFWLRPGDSYTTNNFLSFLKDTLDKLSGIEVGLLRADSGFIAKRYLTIWRLERSSQLVTS
ncbi:MAG: hypothetical protein CVU06_15925 [Bacteroidetes bacterium HGW-Bacteroidetes-22]|nr:MAG: hypothetical protein CVU06_15925 [Bacteroidetes bacterium HGW-Bacteroidetes-22]